LIRKIANSFRKLGLPNFRNQKIVPKFLRFVRLSGIRKVFFGASVKKKLLCTTTAVHFTPKKSTSMEVMLIIFHCE
jgi:hypothetical protein